MTHILSINDFINESRGAKLIYRTPDRFNSDKLANKKVGGVLQKQIGNDNGIIDDYVVEELYDDTDYNGVWGFDSEGFVEIDCNNGQADMYISINNILEFFGGDLNKSQKNAFTNIGINTGVAAYDYDENVCRVTYEKNLEKFSGWLYSHMKNASGGFGVGDEYRFYYDAPKYNRNIMCSISGCNIGYCVSMWYDDDLINDCKSNEEFLSAVKSAYANIVNDVLHVFDNEIFNRILNTKM